MLPLMRADDCTITPPPPLLAIFTIMFIHYARQRFIAFIAAGAATLHARYAR